MVHNYEDIEGFKRDNIFIIMLKICCFQRFYVMAPYGDEYEKQDV